MTLEITRPVADEGQTGAVPTGWPHPEITGLFMSVGEGDRHGRVGNAARAVVDLVTHPSHWQLRREFVPVKGNPHGKDEGRSKLVLRHKQRRPWDE